MAQYDDKSLEYISQTQTLIGQKKRNLIEQTHGNLLQSIKSQKGYTALKIFGKCYLMTSLRAWVIDNKQLDIFVYICENTNSSTNLFIGTYTKIAKDVGVDSRPTISAIMKKLQEVNFIRKVQSGVWFVNPNILMKGNDQKRQILLSYYESDEPVEQLTYSRTKQKAIPTAHDQQQIPALEEGETND